MFSLLSSFLSCKITTHFEISDKGVHPGRNEKNIEFNDYPAENKGIITQGIVTFLRGEVFENAKDKWKPLDVNSAVYENSIIAATRSGTIYSLDRKHKN
ncbi:MAG TPA: hypothetical protein ENI15_05435 [Spirochaetes bacterium]|nr:hypothetical protein [Spirochaetota bacterium]